MKRLLPFLVSCGLVIVAAAAASAQQLRTSENAAKQLAKVKALYASASYEEALANLEMIAPAEASEQVEQYRALCFLALNRLPEAERALETIVRRAPFHRMSDAEVSPRLVAMFVDVRRRVLPAAARETYARARWNYQGGQYDEAAADLRQLLAMLADPDLANAPRDLMDLKLVAEGFLKLAEAEIARQPARPAAPRSAAPDGPPPANDPPVPAPLRPRPPVENGSGPSRIYDDDDRSVKAPIELSRQMPAWTPPPGFVGQEFRGVLELVVDESGRVTSAVSLGAVMPNYDDALRAAARQWKYRPAMLRDGTPVRYRLHVGYLLKPTQL